MDPSKRMTTTDEMKALIQPYAAPDLSRGTENLKGMAKGRQMLKNFGDQVSAKVNRLEYLIIKNFVKGDWVTNKAVLEKLKGNISDLTTQLKGLETDKQANVFTETNALRKELGKMLELCKLLKQTGIKESRVRPIEILLDEALKETRRQDDHFIQQRPNALVAQKKASQSEGMKEPKVEAKVSHFQKAQPSKERRHTVKDIELGKTRKPHEAKGPVVEEQPKEVREHGTHIARPKEDIREDDLKKFKEDEAARAREAKDAETHPEIKEQAAVGTKEDNLKRVLQPMIGERGRPVKQLMRKRAEAPDISVSKTSTVSPKSEGEQITELDTALKRLLVVAKDFVTYGGEPKLDIKNTQKALDEAREIFKIVEDKLVDKKRADWALDGEVNLGYVVVHEDLPNVKVAYEIASKLWDSLFNMINPHDESL